NSYADIQRSLAGRSPEIGPCRMLEEQLIHFLYGRKLAQSEPAPHFHSAQHMTVYIQALCTDTDRTVEHLYRDLCQIAHPAAQSVHWLLEAAPTSLRYSEMQDDEATFAVIVRHIDAFSTIIDV